MDDSQQKITILAVDDSRVMLVAATKALKAEFEVLKASDGQEAWEVIQEHPEIALVFSDLSMPEMDGYGLLAAIRQSENAQIAKLPVVILTGQEDGDGTKEKVMAAGATDFITKPFESLDLLSRARSLSKLSTEVNELEKKVSLDKLTQLYTEVSFNDSGERSVAYAKRHATPISVMRLDIDDFSTIFIKHGKEVAESIVVKVSEIIKTVLRQEDIAARTGVAKFSLLLIETDQEGVKPVINRLRKAVSDAIFDAVGKITISIGSASSDLDNSFQLKNIREKAEENLAKSDVVADEEKAETTQENIETKAVSSKKKKGPRIDLSAVMREIENNNGKRLGETQLNAALNSVLPLLSFLNKEMSLHLDDVIGQLDDKVDK